jgi:hypothetical protein
MCYHHRVPASRALNLGLPMLNGLAEVLFLSDLLRVIAVCAAETSQTIEQALAHAGVSAEDWAQIEALGANPLFPKIRDVARAVGVEIVAVRSLDAQPWRDPHNPQKSAPRSTRYLLDRLFIGD